ncbi:hypothetical protein HOY82DRAFT_578469 [Tuber indicum]|nr:hypothetical protein HOY82DRAFT_578469 [Tuber indicum]
MTPYCSAVYNTLFYDAVNPKAALCGCRQNGSITKANFLSILQVLIVIEGKDECVWSMISGHIFTRNNKALAAQDYAVLCDYAIQVNDEPWIQRLRSPGAPGTGTRFCDDIRAGDKKCIRSAHNEFLVDLAISQLINQYLISINPDGGWHFRQPVLANRRGLGEPIFEHDFPPGTDMVGKILACPKGKERFELEMASKLSGLY